MVKGAEAVSLIDNTNSDDRHETEKIGKLIVSTNVLYNVS